MKKLLSMLKFTRAKFFHSLLLMTTLCWSPAQEMEPLNCYIPRLWSQLESSNSLNLVVLLQFPLFLTAKIYKNSTYFLLVVKMPVRSQQHKQLRVVSLSDYKASFITRLSERSLAISVQYTLLPFPQMDSALPQALRTAMCISISCFPSTLPKNSSDHPINN